MASIIFYPDKEKNEKSLILLSFTFNNARLRLSTGLHVPKANWDQEGQKAKPTKDYGDINKRLREINSFFLDKYDELFPQGGMKFTKEEVSKKSAEILEAFKVFTGRKPATEVVRISFISFIPIFQERYKDRYKPTHVSHYNGLKTHLYIPEHSDPPFRSKVTPHSGHSDPPLF